MVLEHLGEVRTEAELRALTDSEFESEFYAGGATALSLVDAAREVGFSNSVKHNLEFQELLWALSQGHFPIVYLSIRLRPGTPLQRHAVVVTEIDEGGVRLLDPVRGEVTHTVEEFNAMWGRTRGLTILIG
jgi:ABC-type bacteriocin/lantibiotic exporter with double-glycine peptidase domain